MLSDEETIKRLRVELKEQMQVNINLRQENSDLRSVVHILSRLMSKENR